MLNTEIYNVYKTSTGLYVPEHLCTTYNVGNIDEQRDIKGIMCYKVNENDIERINEQSSHEEIKLVPNYISLFDLQIVLSFTVYKDINHDNKLYIADSTCTKYEIEPISKRIINNTSYANVTEEDIDKVENATKNERIALKRKYEEISLDDEVKPAEHLFIYYLDYETNKKFVNRDTFELARKNEIDIEGTPKIINNKNCYSITEDQLKEIEIKTGYRGVEQLIKKEIKPIHFNIEKTKEAVEKIFNTPHKEEKKPIKFDITKTCERIDSIFEKQDTSVAPIAYNNNQLETLVIYKDKKTNKLYAPFKKYDDQEPTKILNKQYYEVNIEDLESIKDKKIVVVSVYLVEKKTYDITICNNKGALFISKNILDELGFYIENPHKILVNKEVYEEIAEEDIELIKAKESDSCHINIIEKQITPKRG